MATSQPLRPLSPREKTLPLAHAEGFFVACGLGSDLHGTAAVVATARKEV